MGRESAPSPITKLPRLAQACRDSRNEAKPLWKDLNLKNKKTGVQNGESNNKHQRSKQNKKTHTNSKFVQLSALDQRILVLYNSKLRRTIQESSVHNKALQNQNFSAEAFHAALSIQRVWRGYSCRKALWAFYGPINQQKALLIQKVYRGHKGRQLYAAKRSRRLFLAAQKIQSMIRGVLARDHFAIMLVQDTMKKVELLQRVYRGYRGRCVANRLRFIHHSINTLTIQRVYRGHRGREFVKQVIYQNQANARAIANASRRHAVSQRCKGCSWNHSTEQSLLACTFVRLVGLFDVHGAKQLATDGLNRFPTQAMFPFLLSIILQVQCESLEVAMVYLERAKIIGFIEQEMKKYEQIYFFAALEWQPGNPAICLTFAVYLQCLGLIRRAETFYKQSLNVNPLNYPLDNYLARKSLAEHIVLNFKRFLSLFKLPAGMKVNITCRRFSLPKSNGQFIEVQVTRLNHFAVFTTDKPSICNSIFVSDDEITQLFKETKSSHEHDVKQSNTPTRPQNDKGRRKALINVQRRRHISWTPKEQSAVLHDSRTTVKLSTEQTELLLNQIVILPSTITTTPPTYLMVLPRLLRLRAHQAWAITHYEALINIQRIYRGYVVRCSKMKQRLCERIRDDQIHQLQQRLLVRKNFRIQRAKAATRIQALRRGVLTRRQLNKMAMAATKIQSIIRRELARRHVEDIRQGNFVQYPVVRVFHRGVEIQGKLMVLSIDQRGLSFKFTGIDHVGCCVYYGCCPRDRTLQMIRYWHEVYAEKCIGQTMYHLGKFGTVVAIDTTSPDIRLFCQIGNSSQISLSLMDAGLAIRCASNLAKRQQGNLPKEVMEIYPLPVDPANVDQLVAALLPHLALVPTMVIPTRQMQKNSAAMSLAIIAPETNPLFVPSLVPSKYPSYKKPQLTPALIRQLPKPYQKRLRGDSSLQTRHKYQYPDRHENVLNPIQPPFVPGKAIYRRLCPRHYTTYTRCKCILPASQTSEHVSSLELALSVARPCNDLSRKTILTNEIPNRSHRMWQYEKRK